MNASPSRVPTERLTRKSPCDEVCADASHISDVAEVRHVRPVLFEDFAGIGFNFSEGDCFPSSRLRRQSKAADSRKEVQMSKTMTANKSLDRIALTPLSLEVAGFGGRHWMFNGFLHDDGLCGQLYVRRYWSFPQRHSERMSFRVSVIIARHPHHWMSWR